MFFPGWREGPPLPQARISHCMAQISENEVLIAGGSRGQPSQPMKTSLILNLDTMKYSTVGDLANEEGTHSCTFFQGKVYLVARGSRKTEIFDPLSKKWSPGPTFPHQILGRLGNLVAENENDLFYSDSERFYKLVQTTQTWESVHEVQNIKLHERALPPRFVITESIVDDNQKCNFATLQ